MMAAIKQSITRSVPVVVVLGSTGTGKSKLAIQIAKHLDGEIISADSMQVYRGLDIVTNKVSSEEQAECPHHLIDYISPLHTQYTVVDYQRAALPIIDGLLKRNKLPVIVGGTNYYIESLLWKYLLTDVQTEGESVSSPKKFRKEKASISSDRDQRQDADEENEAVDQSDANCSEMESLVSKSRLSPVTSHSSAQIDTPTLYARLSEVDPPTARRIHPNNRRKIIRALEVYDQHGVTASELYQTQHGAGQAISGPLRYHNLCVLWIQCQQTVLDERLDARVEDMMSRGLLKELEDFHLSYNRDRMTNHSKVDYQLGIFQNIGFKEFHSYLILSEEEKNTDKGKQLLTQGIAELKRVTRKYAKKQVRWITNRFLKRPGQGACPVYALDGTDVTRWEENVGSPALGIVSSLIQGRTPTQEPLPLEPQGKNPAVYNVCEACGGKVFVTLADWNLHINSKRHRYCEIRKRKEDLGLSPHERIEDQSNQPSNVT